MRQLILEILLIINLGVTAYATYNTAVVKETQKRFIYTVKDSGVLEVFK